MSDRTRAAVAEQIERRLVTSGASTPTRLCTVVDVLPSFAADGRDLVVVDWDGAGTPVRVHRASTYTTPAVGDLALVIVPERTPVAAFAVVAPPPEE